MKRTFTKKQRLVIYKRLLDELDTPIETSWNSGFYLCWKLSAEIIGIKAFKQLESFDDDIKELVSKTFPEFSLSLGNRFQLTMASRIDVLKGAITLCEPKPKTIKLKQLEAWLGSDQDNSDNLKKMLLEIANGKYSVEMLRSDILSYE